MSTKYGITSEIPKGGGGMILLAYGVQNDHVRDTVITHSRLAWRHERAQAAVASRHGLQALPIEGLAARLAGGFLQTIDPDALKAAVTKALSADLGDLEPD